MQEVELPSEAERLALRAAFLSVVYDGQAKAVRALERAWPSGARWPSGEAYLRTLGWRTPDELTDSDEADAYADNYDGPELMALLYQRLFHVSNRMHRDEQVRGFLDPTSSYFSTRCVGVVVNRFGLLSKRQDPCGIGKNKRFGKEEALELLRSPAHSHPACRCTVDPDLRKRGGT